MLQISFIDVKFIPWNTIIIIVIIITIHMYKVLLISQGKHYSKYLMWNNLFCSNSWKGIYIEYKQESSQDPKAPHEPDSLWPPSADFLLLILSQALWPTCHSSDTVGTTSGGAWALVTPVPGVPSARSPHGQPFVPSKSSLQSHLLSGALPLHLICNPPSLPPMLLCWYPSSPLSLFW